MAVSPGQRPVSSKQEELSVLNVCKLIVLGKGTEPGKFHAV